MEHKSLRAWPMASILVVLLTIVSSDALLSSAGPAVSDEVVRGKPVRLTHQFGAYVRYVSDSAPRAVLVLIHGTLGENESAIDVAEQFVNRWTDLAARRQLVVLAPASDQQNYGGHAGPGGGFRGLFGRNVGADAFVNALVEVTRESIRGLPEKFYLYGHSAGGQFVSRYLVLHPDRVEAAVISAAGTFAFPDPDVAWTNGMKPLERGIRWSDDEPERHIRIVPDARGWLQAAQLPVAVVVGERDTAEIKPIPGNPGRTHVERAQNWVRAMQTLAREHAVKRGVRLIKVKNVGHSSAELTPTCQRALFSGPVRSTKDAHRGKE